MKNKLIRFMHALDSERVYGSLLTVIGIACLVFSSFAPIILDAVTLGAGILLLFGALARLLLLLLSEDRREILYFSNLLKEALLIFAGIILVLFRSNFASAVCTALGVYLILRSVAFVVFIVAVGRKDGLSPMEKAEIIFSVITFGFGLCMIIFPRFANILVGIILLGKGLELNIKHSPNGKEKGEDKKDDFITDDFVDKSDE